jgi:hypothetical protein
MRTFLAATITVIALAVTLAALPASAGANSCPIFETSAVIAGKHVCLHNGLRCSKRYERKYRSLGYECVRGRLHRLDE